MAGPKPEKYSPTGRMVFRKMLEKGWDRRRLAEALYGDPGAQTRLTLFFRRNHTTPTLLEVAEVLGCQATELLPASFFVPSIANNARESGS